MRTTGGANWNVIGVTDLGGHLVERYVLTPYGKLTVYQETGYGDYDEDYDVMGDPPSTSDPDYTAFTGACAGSAPTGACRILDLDFDGDVDTTDRDTYFMSLPHGLMRHPGRIATAVDQPFGHQGLLFEPELGQYQNRARQYDPGKKRFAQRDPLGYLQGLSLIQYLRSNPISSLDPSGEDAFPFEVLIISDDEDTEEEVVVWREHCFKYGFDQRCSQCIFCSPMFSHVRYNHDAIEHIREAYLHFGGQLCQVHISGHSCVEPGAEEFQGIRMRASTWGADCFAPGNSPKSLTPTDVAWLELFILPNGFLRLHGCYFTEEYVENFASRLKRVVCGCKDDIPPGPCPCGPGNALTEVCAANIAPGP